MILNRNTFSFPVSEVIEAFVKEIQDTWREVARKLPFNEDHISRLGNLHRVPENAARTMLLDWTKNLPPTAENVSDFSLFCHIIAIMSVMRVVIESEICALHDGI